MLLWARSSMVKIVQYYPVAPVDDVVILNIGDYVIDAYQLDRVRGVLVRIGEQTVHGHQGEDKIALGNVGEIGATGNLVGNAQSVQFAQIFTVNGVEYGFDIYISPAGSS